MTSTPDFYSSLGVERTASRASIVAAFRRLAMQWHPDRHFNAADKAEAEKRFKAIKTAYEILSDDSRREHYDRECMAGPEMHRESARPQWSRHRSWGREYADRDRAESEHSQRSSAPRGDDVHKKVAVPIAEAYQGTHISFEETTREHCEQCAGSRGEHVRCSRCHGFSKYSRFACQVCRNSGKEWVNCAPCHGVGTVERKRRITVRTPAGMVDGSVLTVRERGKPSEQGGLNGDLHITISVKPEAGWKRKGLHLTGALKLPYSIALLGGEIDVPLPTGKTVQVRVPARTDTGKKIRLAGLGLFDAAKDERGDVLLNVSIVLPSGKRRLTPEMEALLREIDGGK